MPGHPDIFVIGDAAAVTGPDGQPVPGTIRLGGFAVVRPLGTGLGSSVFVVRRGEQRHDPHARGLALKVSRYDANTARAAVTLATRARIVAAASKLQGHMTSGPATPSQIAALAALTDPSCDAVVSEMHAAFTRRREFMLAGLAQLPGVDTFAPDGAFYLYADVSRHLGPGTQFADDLAFATWLLEQKLVATVPGTAFGTPGYLRISYATDDASLRAGLTRMQEAFATLPTAR